MQRITPTVLSGLLSLLDVLTRLSIASLAKLSSEYHTSRPRGPKRWNTRILGQFVPLRSDLLGLFISVLQSPEANFCCPLGY